MDGMAAITARMAQIDAQIASVTSGARLAAARSGQTSAGTTATSAPTFASALSDAVAATGAPSPTTGIGSAATTTARSGQLNADGVPVELAAYGNGRIPASALAPIGDGSHRLWAPAAAAFQQMSAAAKQDGVKIGVTDSYRSFDEQVDVARRKGLHSQGGLAAKPGTSEHGWGKSLDLDLDTRAQSWMRVHGSNYGFTENVSREPWHWTYAPA